MPKIVSTAMNDSAEDLIMLDEGEDFMYRYEYDRLTEDEKMEKNVSGVIPVNSPDYETTLIAMGEIEA